MLSRSGMSEEAVAVRNYAPGDELIVSCSELAALKLHVERVLERFLLRMQTSLPSAAVSLSRSVNEMTSAQSLKRVSPDSPPNSLNQTRDTNTISVSHDHLMVSKRPMIITHIIKPNN